MSNETSGDNPSKTILFSPEITKEKINKSKLRRDIDAMSKSDVTYLQTNYIPVPQKNFMSKGNPNGKVFYQVRIGYIFYCFKHKKINTDASLFFGVTATLIEQYCISLVLYNDLIQRFPKHIITIFEQEADNELIVAYNKLKEFNSTSLLHQLKNYKEMPIIGLLEKQNKLNGLNKFNDYNIKKDINASEQNLWAISKRTSDQKTVFYYEATKEVNSKRKLKTYLPSVWVASKVLNALCDIHNRQALSVAGKRALNRSVINNIKQEIIRLHIEGMPNTEIEKIVNAKRSKIASIIREFKRSEIVKKEAIVNNGNSIIATKNSKNNPFDPTTVIIEEIDFINPVLIIPKAA
jgi:hypothetical protein